MYVCMYVLCIEYSMKQLMYVYSGHHAVLIINKLFISFMIRRFLIQSLQNEFNISLIVSTVYSIRIHTQTHYTKVYTVLSILYTVLFKYFSIIVRYKYQSLLKQSEIIKIL